MLSDLIFAVIYFALAVMAGRIIDGLSGAWKDVVLVVSVASGALSAMHLLLLFMSGFYPKMVFHGDLVTGAGLVLIGFCVMRIARRSVR